MTRAEFESWKKEWFERVAGCKEFACVHELSSCAIKPLCGCGSIYETYIKQETPIECLEVTCKDCFLKHECKKTKEELWDIV